LDILYLVAYSIRMLRLRAALRFMNNPSEFGYRFNLEYY